MTEGKPSFNESRRSLAEEVRRTRAESDEMRKLQDDMLQESIDNLGLVNLRGSNQAMRLEADRLRVAARKMLEDGKAELLADPDSENFDLRQYSKIYGLIKNINHRKLDRESVNMFTQTVIDNKELLHKCLRREKLPLVITDMNRLASWSDFENNDIPSRKKVARFALEFIEDDLEFISSQMQQNKEWGTNYLEAIMNLGMHGNIVQKITAMDMLFSSREYIKAGTASDNWDQFIEFCSALGLLAAQGNAEQKAWAIKTIHAEIQSSRDVNRKVDLASQFFRDDAVELEHEGTPYLQKYLRAYGLDASELLSAWEDSSSDHDEAIRMNFDALALIEIERPGIAQFLIKEFGIRDFGRYPTEMLIKQYDQFEDVKHPYGLLINPRADNNGAWYSEHDEELLTTLMKDLGEDFNIRVVECASKIEIARILIKLDRKYGAHQKISFAKIAGHGVKESIIFGEDEPKNYLHINDLVGPGLQRTGRYFIPNPTFILDSCSTGAQDGIGQKLSEVLNAKVIAPEKPSAITSIKVQKDESGLSFEVKYDDAYFNNEVKSNVYQKGQPAVKDL